MNSAKTKTTFAITAKTIAINKKVLPILLERTSALPLGLEPRTL
jgi:hypothetical protein